MSTTSALHTGTGEWELIPANRPWPTQPANPPTKPQVRTGPLLVAAGIIGGCGILLLVVYRAMLDQTAEQIASRVEAVQHAVTGRLAEVERRMDAAEGREEDRAALVREHTGFARAVMEQLDRIESAAPERLGERLAEVERTVEEQDQEYERGWVDGAAKTADALSRSNGKVRQLPSAGGAPPRANGSHPSGIDAEAISMAREFSERIRRLEHES